MTITSVSTSPPSTGRMITRSISIPPTNEIASVPSRASPSGSPACSSPQAMNVLNIASSPCAKLTIPVER